MVSVLNSSQARKTGADSAALDWAIGRGIPHGGLCPKGRKAEDGPIPAQYQVQETPSADYLQRNEWNVRDSEGTVIFTIGVEIGGGSRRTGQFATKLERPWLHLHEGIGIYACARKLKEFMSRHSIEVVNVADLADRKSQGWGSL